MSTPENKFSTEADFKTAIDSLIDEFAVTTAQYRNVLRGSLTWVFEDKLPDLASTLGYDKGSLNSFLEGNNGALLCDEDHMIRQLKAIRREMP